MPRAEVGTTKYLSNKMKAKGLQRLRWYCQVCEKQCRDENGFKCHTQSESHVRQMLVVSEDSKKYIDQYSNQFKHDFLSLLRTSHGEKKIDANRFYQEYIANKEHIHMNATRWLSLSEFVKYLGREGLCRVEEGEKGFFISWIDNSPEALRRAEIIRKKERQDRGDEEREQKAIQEQIEKARRDAEVSGRLQGDEEEQTKILRREAEGERIKLNFGAPKTTTTPPAEAEEPKNEANKPAPVAKKKNIFAALNKRSKSDNKLPASNHTDASKRPVTEAERIMKEELEQKRVRSAGAGPSDRSKRQRLR